MAHPTSTDVKAAANAAKTVGLSTSGMVFFGSLCVGTFGLGVWQLQRLLEKQELIEERTNQLQLDPTKSHDLSWLQPKQMEEGDKHQNSHYRRRSLRGMFRYEHEVLVGPRGAPPGVTIPREGLSKKSGGNAGSGSAPGPQGYHVLTPLELAPNNSHNSKVVWVNRGWIPKKMIPTGNSAGRRRYQRGSNQQEDEQHSATPTQIPITWDRPSGLVEITAVQTSPERPRMMTPEHDFSNRPPKLFWLDGSLLNAIIQPTPATDDGQNGKNKEVILLTQIQKIDNVGEVNEQSQRTQQQALRYPLTPTSESVGEFKTTPLVHAGYAATWFGLSGAGIYMTRKLILRGRG